MRFPAIEDWGYRPKQAELIAAQRATNSRNGPIIKENIWQATLNFLSQNYSPEQIASQIRISHETIYRRIYLERSHGGELYHYLRCQKKRRKRYASDRDRRGQIMGHRPISERPSHIDERMRVGHWEGDTVIGRGHKQVIVSLVERKSGYAVIRKVSNKTPDLVSAAIIESLTPIANKVKTITFDNGKEFAEHAKIDKALSSISYFADPYASWQRGSNENYNGLFRQYVPKDRPLSTVTDQELKMIEYELNNRPRKRLGFKTPHQVFWGSNKSVALRG